MMAWCKSVFGAFAGACIFGVSVWLAAGVVAVFGWVTGRALQERPACPNCGSKGVLPMLTWRRHPDGYSYWYSERHVINCERCNP